MTEDAPSGGLQTYRPRICILAGDPGWAFDNSAREIKRQLATEFDITIHHAVDRPTFSAADCDLLHICFWGESRHQLIDFDKRRIITEISSHRWQDNPNFGPCTPAEFVRRYLAHCDTAILQRNIRRLWCNRREGLPADISHAKRRRRWPLQPCQKTLTAKFSVRLGWEGHR